MARNAGGEDITATEGENSQSQPDPIRSSSDKRLRTRADPFLIVCRVFNLITALTALLCLAVNVLSAVRCFKDGSDIFNGIFRCYAVALAFFVAVVETEWSFILKFWKVLEYWLGRGMLQIFVAVMTRAFLDDSDDQQGLILLQNIASYMLLACGLVYCILGILCIGFLKRGRQKEAITRDQACSDLEDLERRRLELEALLLENRA